ncbi:RICIN domain-containing protein [Streptomyces sp. NPDC001340]
MTVGSGTAHADGWHSYENYLTDRCLAGDDASHWAYASYCDDDGWFSGRQRWYEFYTPDGAVMLVNGYNNLCLGVDGTDGAVIEMCNTSDKWQHWWKQPYKNGFTLKNVGNEHCLDDSFAYNLRAIWCNNTDWQGWWY